MGLRAPTLTLDPALLARIRSQTEAERQARAEEVTRALFDPATVEAAARDLHAMDTPTGALGPAPPAGQQPLVPAGEGPETAQAGSAGDVARAIMQVPAVQTAMNNLREQATQRLRRDWRRLSTGERAAVISMSVFLAGGLVAGVASNAGARETVLSQLDGRDIPMGPFSVHIDRPDPGQFGVTLNVDLAQLVPGLAR
jgi:hypothetical protein